MKSVELYANSVIMVNVDLSSFENITEDYFAEIVHDIIFEVQKAKLGCDDIVESIFDGESKSAKLFFLKSKDSECLVHTFECVENTSDLIEGEYIIFSDMIADSFNSSDKYGMKDFSKGDEIPVKGVSRIIDEDTMLSRYRLGTYVVIDEPFDLVFTKDMLRSDKEEV